MRLERLRWLVLWMAVSALMLLAIAHAFEHPVLAATVVHDCPVCAHAHHGAAPLEVPGAAMIIAAPPAPRPIAWSGRGPVPTFCSVYLSRGPPSDSFI